MRAVMSSSAFSIPTASCAGNLPADTPVDQLLAKLAELMKGAPDPAKFMPVSAVQEMMRDRRNELGLHRQERVVAKVQKALDTYHITNGMRAWAMALCESNEAAFDEFCASAPTFAYLFRETNAANFTRETERQDHSPLEQTICEQLGLKPGTLSN